MNNKREVRCYLYCRILGIPLELHSEMYRYNSCSFIEFRFELLQCRRRLTADILSEIIFGNTIERTVEVAGGFARNRRQNTAAFMETQGRHRSEFFVGSAYDDHREVVVIPGKRLSYESSNLLQRRFIGKK